MGPISSYCGYYACLLYVRYEISEEGNMRFNFNKPRKMNNQAVALKCKDNDFLAL
jgi:hypothetical protein